MWGLWGGLPLPTLGIAFDDARLEEIHVALEAHRGELIRNDYRRLVTGRSMMYGSLGPELLFGFGAAAKPEAPNVELLTEAAWTGERWLLGMPRWLDPAAPLTDPSPIEAGDWLEAKSFAARLRRAGS